MAFSTPSQTGMQLFEDDGTPIRWQSIHSAAWNCGHIAAETGLSCPFPPKSPLALCWEAGFAWCQETGNRTPAGRKRKPTKPDAMIQRGGVACFLVGTKRELQAFLKDTGLSLLSPDDQPRQTIRPEGALALLDALAALPK